MVRTDKEWAERVADVDYYDVVALMAQSLFYGMFLVIFIISCVLLIQQRRTLSVPRRILFGSILFIGVAMTINFSLEIAGTLIQMSWPHHLVSSATLYEKLVAADKLSHVPRAGMWVVMPLVYIVADAMPIWRAYVMWSHNKIVKVVLLVLFGLNTAVCITQGVYLAIDELRDTNNDRAVLQSIIYAATLLFSVIVNAISTSLIGYQVWIHRTLIRKSSLNSSLTIKMLVLIVEAGLALCVIQIINASTLIASRFTRITDPREPLSLSTNVWTPFGDSFAASYPSLIVIIMAYRHSVLDTLFQDSQAGGHVMTTMSFAQRSSSNEVTLKSTNQESSLGQNHLFAGTDEIKAIETV
ncbi:hypothetical protein DL96DRAFT_1686032 [Flagelloscypha sp. PMI_526]|nr:hypothetical protein DL96DRAFT_1686032 [Flagelloscypha sp. PMI_526]